MAFLPPRISITSDQCIRRALTPLAALAARTGAVVMLIRHLTKMLGLRALYRGSGSIGVIGAARTGLIVGRHPADPEQRILAVTKSNLARTPLSLSYRINSDAQGRAVLEWIGPVEFKADDLCERTPGPLRPRERAIGWLVQELKGGPRKASELYAAAVAAKIPEKTLLRAKKDLSAESHQVHYKTGRREWFWYDPAAPWPANAPFPRPLSLMEQLGPAPTLGPLGR